jgi:hypothetical protein
MRLLLSLGGALLVLFSARLALADRVAVLPFTAPKGLSKPEIDRAQAWAREAVLGRGHVPPNDSEMLSATMAVKDGAPDTSQEYMAAGRASGAQWTVTGRVERRDAPSARLPDGTMQDGYTSYRIELEVAQVETGRVESLAREIDPDDAPAQLGEMLGLLLRPEGLRNATLPWENAAPRPPPQKGKPPPAEPPLPPAAPPPPAVRHAYAEGHAVALGVSAGLAGALAAPTDARGPSSALPLGGVVAYALEQAPGVELRGGFTSQVLGPRALELTAGGRYAVAALPQHRLFVGPEVLAGVHVALGADKTARFLGRGAAFVAWGLGERVQLELAADLGVALGGTGTLVLGGGTARALLRF